MAAVAPAGRAAESVPPNLSPVAVDDVLQVGLGLVLVVVAIVVAAALVRRFFRLTPGAQGRLRVVCGLTMGSRERIVLLQVGEVQLLLGVSPGRIQTLHVLEQPLEGIELGGPGGLSFREQLKHALKPGRLVGDARD